MLRGVRVPRCLVNPLKNKLLSPLYVLQVGDLSRFRLVNPFQDPLLSFLDILLQLFACFLFGGLFISVMSTALTTLSTSLDATPQNNAPYPICS